MRRSLQGGLRLCPVRTEAFKRSSAVRRGFIFKAKQTRAGGLSLLAPLPLRSDGDLRELTCLSVLRHGCDGALGRSDRDPDRLGPSGITYRQAAGAARPPRSRPACFLSDRLPGPLPARGVAPGPAWAAREESRDTREGQNVTLECRYGAPTERAERTYYWTRANRRGQDNVAVQRTPLDTRYALHHRPEEGVYDLLITNSSYELDHGRFECHIKEPGTGKSLHLQAYELTVLSPPGPPQVAPGPAPTLTEGKPAELACSSVGGSPSPTIRWYRDGNTYPLEAEIRPSKWRDSPTTAVLSLTPARTDDGAVYRCVVWNRALPDGARLDTNVTLSVNYFPRVEVGPENPYRVERDGTATLRCSVDARPRATSIEWSREGHVMASTEQLTVSRVTLQDAGRYTCSASNGLDRPGQADVLLEVLYAPMVSIDSGAGGTVSHREVEEGETVKIRCNVSSNPAPVTVEWVREGHPEFRQNGHTLLLSRITAEAAGTYTCRAVNYLNPSGPRRGRLEKVGNASISLLVRHRPGQASISPDRPVAQEGSGVTLTCSTNPPGWPVPQYRWWRDGGGSGIGDSGGNAVTVLATGSKYSIPSAQLFSEGRYMCQATNEMGPGEPASVTLEVYQPPRFLAKLQPHITKRAGDAEFSAVCNAQGKPRPVVRWLKDGRELTPDSSLLEVSTDENVGPRGVVTVQSSLRFVGSKRPGGNTLIPSDRGVYSCVFENEVKRAESSMHLLIEHAPVVLHQYDKVAYDPQETAEVVCRVQAYPRPEIQWSYGTNTATLLPSSHYEINNTAEGRDTYTSILRVSKIRSSDYGDYYCRVTNSLGSIKPAIRLQPKGLPEHPRSVEATEIGPNYVVIGWEPGFDGGLQHTKFYVSYQRLSGNDAVSSNCHTTGVPVRASNSDGWQEMDCHKNNPCNVTELEQHQTYVFKVRAVNSKGHSNYSSEVRATTKVDKLAPPQQVGFDPESRTLSVLTAPSCLRLLGVVEATTGGVDWRPVERLPLAGGQLSEVRLASLVLPPAAAITTPGEGRQYNRGGAETSSTPRPRLRVKLCLAAEQEHCSDYTEAEIGPSYINKAGAIATPTLIAIIVSCIVFVLFVGLVFIFCRCKKNQNKKTKSKDYEMESSTVRPSLVAQQPPPPYYPPSGMENKALEHSLDLALDDPTKNPVYASQNGYGYHGGQPTQQAHNINGAEWVNMGYMDNSYSNSNNGGSVNSQDSLWQMKMAAQANNNSGAANGGNAELHQRMGDRGNTYGYDPLTHGGYGGVDDYAPYPHASATEHEYHGPSNPPRPQDFNNDPYAAVHKSKKRMDQHLDSPYHDVSGLPDPYMDQMDCDDSKPQHISLSFDESLESGYSTPNSRNRRVIREIIV
ncbi:hemicentin-2 [Schistocerca piceifrons]|uniref:hemicentin-2 n=1 Tax=Schistocerca piceifrons TaxID=274613 RepID=UPI001F5F3637|nr:hemicentin-2 [Schistocerca piceifrons]